MQRSHWSSKYCHWYSNWWKCWLTYAKANNHMEEELQDRTERAQALSEGGLGHDGALLLWPIHQSFGESVQRGWEGNASFRIWATSKDFQDYLALNPCAAASDCSDCLLKPGCSWSFFSSVALLDLMVIAVCCPFYRCASPKFNFPGGHLLPR